MTAAANEACVRRLRTWKLLFDGEGITTLIKGEVDLLRGNFSGGGNQ